MIHYPSMRNHMKALAVLAGIKENLCYHVGRHSFASLVTLEAGVPIETISKMLGHGNIQTTQVYARVTPKKLFEDRTGLSRLPKISNLFYNHQTTDIMRSTFSILFYINRWQGKG